MNVRSSVLLQSCVAHSQGFFSVWQILKRNTYVFVGFVSTAPVISSWLRFKSLVNSPGEKTENENEVRARSCIEQRLICWESTGPGQRCVFELIRWGAPELLNWSVLLKKKMQILQSLRSSTNTFSSKILKTLMSSSHLSTAVSRYMRSTFTWNAARLHMMKVHHCDVFNQNLLSS